MELKPRDSYRVTDRDNDDTKDPWLTIQKHNDQFRAKKYKVKQSELMRSPGQIEQANTDPMDEDLDEPSYSEPQDEIEPLISKLILQLAVTNKKLKWNKHPIDHEQFLREEENDDDNEAIYDADTNARDTSHSGTTPTSSTQTPISNSNEQEDTQSDDSWLQVPNNTPNTTDNSDQDAANDEDLTAALQQVIHELEKFNSKHPTLPPPRRSSRSVPKPHTYAPWRRGSRR